MIWDGIACSVGDDVTDIAQKKIMSFEIYRIMSDKLTPAFVSEQIEKLEYRLFLFENSFPDDRAYNMLVKHIQLAYEGHHYIFAFSKKKAWISTRFQNDA